MKKRRQTVHKADNRVALKPYTQMGSPGFGYVSGYIDERERNPALIGDQKYVTAANILSNISIVSAGLTYYLNLAAEAQWSVDPAHDLGPDIEPSDESKRVAEFIESCMYDMEQSWHKTIRRAAMFRFYGFGVQEWTAKRRPDGATGIGRLAARPQHTLKRWDLDDKGEVRGIYQTNPNTFTELYLPRKKVVYMVDDAFTDSPEGHGLVRSLAETADRYQQYLRIEGQGFERDFRGIPVGYAPRLEIMKAVENGAIKKEDAEKLLHGMSALVQAQAKGSRTGAVLDSSVYTGSSEYGETPSAAKKWGIELLTGSANGIEHVGAAIERLGHDMALIIGVDGLMTGRDGGSRALSEDKSRHTYLSVNSTVSDIAEAYEQDFCNPIMKLNGIPDIYKPTLKVEDVSFRTVSEITKSLTDMANAGAILQPNDPVINDVRDMLGVSRMSEEDVAYMMEEIENERKAKDNGNPEI